MSSTLETVQITGLGTSAAPQGYTVVGSQVIELLAISATFDGTSAAGSFLPAVQIITDSGHLLGTCVAAEAAAGDVIEATFAPFLRAPAIASPASSGMVEVDYVERTTDAAAPGNLLVSNAVTVASTSDVFLVHLFSPAVQNDGGGAMQIHSKVGVTETGIVAQMSYLSTAEVFQPLSVWQRFTGIAAGSTTFTVYTTTAGAPPWVVRAGDGTPGSFAPAFLETFRVST